MNSNSLAEKDIFTYESKLQYNECLNLPDRMFYLLCKERYQLNRGNYQTIESWFYEQGITNIISRRIYILAFLDYVTREKEVQINTYLKFGKGGLSSKLKEFFENI